MATNKYNTTYGHDNREAFINEQQMKSLWVIKDLVNNKTKLYEALEE